MLGWATSRPVMLVGWRIWRIDLCDEGEGVLGKVLQGWNLCGVLRTVWDDVAFDNGCRDLIDRMMNRIPLLLLSLFTMFQNKDFDLDSSSWHVIAHRSTWWMSVPATGRDNQGKFSEEFTENGSLQLRSNQLFTIYSPLCPFRPNPSQQLTPFNSNNSHPESSPAETAAHCPSHRYPHTRSAVSYPAPPLLLPAPPPHPHTPLPPYRSPSAPPRS